jgi:DNA polymerase
MARSSTTRSSTTRSSTGTTRPSTGRSRPATTRRTAGDATRPASRPAASASRQPARSAEPYVPADAGLDDLRAAAHGCRGCDLYRNATQAVVSAGPIDARVVLVGEQPGDVEDRRGEPFVGPAGGVLTRALAQVGIPPEQVYLTNAVKHFKFYTRGSSKRRLHDTPKRTEILACRPWLRAEFGLLRPAGVVALGATAAQALAGPAFRVTRHRGQLMDWPDVAEHPDEFPRTDPPARFLATVHPSSVLRADDRHAAFAEFVADLAVLARALAPG